MNPFENDTSNSYNASKNGPQRSQDLQAQIKKSMDRQLQTTTRCLASVYDSQAVGHATAEELMEQGEKLNRAEMNAEKILQDTKQSQRHLNSIKSVFGGIKNWWSGNDKAPPPVVENRTRTNKVLEGALEESKGSRDDHPILSKKAGTLGFFDDDVKEFKDFDPDADFQQKPPSAMKGTALVNKPPPSDNTIAPQSRSQLWNDYEKGMDKNLGEMSNGLNNLKVLAEGMKQEIDSQNDQLDRIADKVDRSDTKVRNQNMQMKRILGK